MVGWSGHLTFSCSFALYRPALPWTYLDVSARLDTHSLDLQVSSYNSCKVPVQRSDSILRFSLKSSDRGEHHCIQVRLSFSIRTIDHCFVCVPLCCFLARCRIAGFICAQQLCTQTAHPSSPITLAALKSRIPKLWPRRLVR